MFSLTSALTLLAGAVAWTAYLGRLLLRSLHMLQLEGYQTGRFLRWSAARQERWARSDRVALALASGALALTGPRHGPWPALVSAAWGAVGVRLWAGARFGRAKKPLVLTARAKRLLAAEAGVGLVCAVGPAAFAWRGGRSDRAIPSLYIGASAASLMAPLVAATANLLLWPVEEGFRRYYLRDARRRLREYNPTVIGVAGSYGKTSTKEFLTTILSARWSVLKPPGSYNTPMGLSRVIREQLEPRHDLFVAELGDWVPGDIRLLCDLIHPRIGVLTTIGPEHLERFKTIERVARTKEELLDALPPDGVAVVNQDDPLVRGLGDRAEGRGLRVLRYGRVPTSSSQPPSPMTVRARDVRTTREGLTFTVVAEGRGEAAFEIGVLGRHNVANVLAATTVALELGMSLPEIAQAARRIAPVEHRLQPIQGDSGVLVIDDAFNSNPRGASEALDVLAELDARRRVLVTPGMVELAEREFDENRILGRKAAGVCDEVILVGRDRARPILAGLRDAGYPESRTHVVGNLAEATAHLPGLIGPGDVVLFENDLPDTYENGTEGAASANSVARGAWLRTPRSSAGEKPGTGPRAAVDNAPMPISPPPTYCVLPDGMRVAYRESGTEQTGPTVVVLHGWGASSAAVASIQRCLEAEHRTIAPDLPGFGASDRPPRAWGSADYAALVRRFLEQLGIERASLIGHSRGGAIAIVLAATAPELVDKLVLVDSAGIRARRGPKYHARVWAFKAARRAGRGLPRRGSIGEWLARRFGSDDYRQAGPMRATLVRVVNEDLRALLPRVTAPTLLIWGERDDATPLPDGRLMEHLIPDAGLVVFPGAGHYAYADDPGRFCRVVSHFLKT